MLLLAALPAAAFNAARASGTLVTSNARRANDVVARLGFLSPGRTGEMAQLESTRYMDGEFDPMYAGRMSYGGQYDSYGYGYGRGMNRGMYNQYGYGQMNRGYDQMGGYGRMGGGYGMNRGYDSQYGNRMNRGLSYNQYNQPTAFDMPRGYGMGMNRGYNSYGSYGNSYGSNRGSYRMDRGGYMMNRGRGMYGGYDSYDGMNRGYNYGQMGYNSRRMGRGGMSYRDGVIDVPAREYNGRRALSYSQ